MPGDQAERKNQKMLAPLLTSLGQIRPPTVLPAAFAMHGVATISQLGSGWALWSPGGEGIIMKSLNPQALVRAALKAGAKRVDFI